MQYSMVIKEGDGDTLMVPNIGLNMSLSYDAEQRMTYLLNNSFSPLLVGINYGGRISADALFETVKHNERFYVDEYEVTQQNQIITVLDCSIQLGREVVAFDYRNKCYWTEDDAGTRFNWYLISTDLIPLEKISEIS